MDHLITGADYLAQFPGFRLEGREAELKRLTSILLRSRASSVLLVGAGGVGCTAICLGVEDAKARRDAPFDLAAKRLFWLDVNALFGPGDPGSIARVFRQIVTRLEEVVGSVLLIEDTRDFIEACRNAGTMHFLNALLGSVRSRRLQLVLEARDDDLDQVLRTSSDARELLTVLPVDEPSGPALGLMVRSSVVPLTRHHGIIVEETAVEAAIELTTKYRPRDAGLSRAQPERTLTLLDRALSTYRLTAHAAVEWNGHRDDLARLYADRRAGDEALSALTTEIDALAAQNPSNDGLSALQSPEVAGLHARARSFREALGINHREAAAIEGEINAKMALTRGHVLAEFSDISGIPVDKLSEDDVVKLRGLEATLARRVFGQEAVLTAVTNGVKVARVGRRGVEPLAYLFLGPSGVGKTELGKALAAALYDDEAAMLRFDMSEYMEKHAVAKLIGAPPGYEGFEAGGILTNAMRRNGNRIIMFDEVEKAHPDVYNVLLQVLSDGRLSDNLGRTASFADALIVLTTNIGQPHFLAPGLTEAEAAAGAMADLAATYRPEFLNRFAGRQNILCFRKLGLDSMERIVRRELDSIGTAYGPRGVMIDIAGSAVGDLCCDRYDPTIGARGLPGYLRVALEPIIVNRLLERPGEAMRAEIAYQDHAIAVRWS